MKKLISGTRLNNNNEGQKFLLLSSLDLIETVSDDLDVIIYVKHGKTRS